MTSSLTYKGSFTAHPVRSDANKKSNFAQLFNNVQIFSDECQLGMTENLVRLGYSDPGVLGERSCTAGVDNCARLVHLCSLWGGLLGTQVIIK